MSIYIYIKNDMLVNMYMLIYFKQREKERWYYIYVCIYIKNYMLVNMYMLIYILSKGKGTLVIYICLYIY